MKKILLILSLTCGLIAPTLTLHAQSAKKEKVAAAHEIGVPEMYVSDNILYIKGAQVGAKLQIVTIVGNKVREIELQSSDVAYELNLPRAIYIFKLQGAVRKFVIK
jgi:hypothetical protein